MPDAGLPADESHSPVLVVGGVSADGGGDGAGVAGRRTRRFGAGGGADGAGAAARPPFSRSAGSRLTFVTVVAGGPTGGAIALPTLILSASGLPVLSTGAAAVGGTA